MGPVEVLVISFPGNQLTGDIDAAALVAMLDRVESLTSDDYLRMLAESLDPTSSEAILVLEHTKLLAATQSSQPMVVCGQLPNPGHIGR